MEQISEQINRVTDEVLFYICFLLFHFNLFTVDGVSQLPAKLIVKEHFLTENRKRRKEKTAFTMSVLYKEL